MRPGIIFAAAAAVALFAATPAYAEHLPTDPISSIDEWSAYAETRSPAGYAPGEPAHRMGRTYDARIGRFLQTDPVGYKDDLNLYQYVGNDPLNRSDPTGRQSVYGDIHLRHRDLGPQGIEREQQASRDAVGGAVEAVLNDPGIVLDAAAIIADVVTVPSGEGPALVVARRGLREGAEQVGEAAARDAGRNSAESSAGVGAREMAGGGRRSPVSRCENCGAPHGRMRDENICPDCYTKREGGPQPRPADRPPEPPRVRRPDEPR